MKSKIKLFIKILGNCLLQDERVPEEFMQLQTDIERVEYLISLR
jgi:hypothetical protein